MAERGKVYRSRIGQRWLVVAVNGPYVDCIALSACNNLVVGDHYDLMLVDFRTMTAE